MQAGTVITSAGGTWDGVFEAASVQSSSSVSAPSGQTVDLVISVGSSTSDLTLTNNAMKITLAGQAGKTVSFRDSSGTQTEVTATCSSTDETAGDPGAGNDCKINDGADLIVLTRHLTDIFTSSTRGGGGGSGGDHTPPSIYVGFDQNEFPLKYAGVKYEPHQFETVHTAVIETGEELQLTLKLYENSGAVNVKHVELYLNQFGSRILNDLTETIVIYDTQSGLEIIDPHNLIVTANVIPSESGNKAVFDFVVVFENEIPQSDIMFRVWDIKRNLMQFHLPDVLVVKISEQSTIVSIEPESGISESVPEVELTTKTWTSEQLSVLKQWGGYDVGTASDIEVLSEFGINGEKIPSYVKQFVKWILDDEVDKEEFVNALQYLKRQGILKD
jgi:hypothetical protein